MGRVDQALDRRVAADTLGFAASSAEAQSLMQLSHEFWVVGPAFAPQPRRMRFSPAVTTHLSARHDNVPPPPTPQKLRALLGRLNRIAAESKPEAAQGKSPGFRNQVFTPDMEALRQAESRGFERGRKEGEAAGRIEGFAQGVEHAPMATSEAPAIPATPPPKRRAAVNGAPAPAGHVPTARAMQLLSTAVTHWPVRFTWSQLAALNGRKARGGHFNSCRKFLADSGFVTEQDGKIEPADAAFEKLGVSRKQKPRTRGEILEMWLAALPSPAKDILREVAAHSPERRQSRRSPAALAGPRAAGIGMAASACCAPMTLSGRLRAALNWARRFHRWARDDLIC
jgi:hypothetical protein